MSYQLLLGDCIQTMRGLPAGSVQTCVTSPPYFGLRDYVTATWEGGDAACDHRLPLSTTRGGPHSTLTSVGAREAVNANTTLTHAAQYRDTCGKCGARRVDDQIGLEATPDAYVAKLVDVFREVRRVLHPTGTVWCNLGDSYSSGSMTPHGGERANRDQGGMSGLVRKPPDGLGPKQLLGMPWRVAFALQADGWYLRSAITWCKGNPMPESVMDRCTSATEMVFMLSKNANYFYDSIAIAENTATPSLANSAGRANGATPRGSTGRPELSATLRTDNGAMSLRGWCNLGESKIAVNGTMAFETKRFQIVELIGIEIGIETAEGYFVMDMEPPICDPATATSIAIALENFFADDAPILASVADIAAAPCGAILTSHIDGNPLAGTLKAAEVVGLDCALVTSEFLVARVTLDCNQIRRSLFVWGAFRSAHVGSFLSKGQNNIVPQENGKRNRRNWWVINSEPYPKSHFATMPTKLVEPCILAGTSAHGCCSKCGAPWARVTDDHKEVTGHGGRDHPNNRDSSRGDVGVGTMYTTVRTTTGWKPTCTCNADVIPCTVLDPFAGSGTTLAVALKHGRRAIGCELNQDYINLIHDRIGRSQPLLIQVTA